MKNETEDIDAMVEEALWLSRIAGDVMLGMQEELEGPDVDSILVVMAFMVVYCEVISSMADQINSMSGLNVEPMNEAEVFTELHAKVEAIKKLEKAGHLGRQVTAGMMCRQREQKKKGSLH